MNYIISALHVFVKQNISCPLVGEMSKDVSRNTERQSPFYRQFRLMAPSDNAFLRRIISQLFHVGRSPYLRHSPIAAQAPL